MPHDLSVQKQVSDRALAATLASDEQNSSTTNMELNTSINNIIKILYYIGVGNVFFNTFYSPRLRLSNSSRTQPELVNTHCPVTYIIIAIYISCYWYLVPGYTGMCVPCNDHCLWPH